MAVSPDGAHLVARFQDEGGGALVMRDLGGLNVATLASTDGGATPFWSADSRRIAFFAGGRLKAVDLAGGAAQTLAEVSASLGGTWSRSGTMLFPRDVIGPIYRMEASGGTPVAVTELDRAAGETSHRFPSFLPDGVHFQYLVLGQDAERSGIYLWALGSNERKLLVRTGSKALFAAPDLLLFLRQSTLMAQRFDTRRLELAGAPVQVADDIASGSSGSAQYSISETGILVYRTGGNSSRRELEWVDRSGKNLGAVGTPAAYENPRLSPDGKRLAVYRPDNGGDLWVMDLERNTSSRLTFDPAIDNVPLWSPDGSRVAFISNREGSVFNIYAKSAAGTGSDELILKTPHNKVLNDWSADGRYLLYQESDPATKNDLWLLPLTGDRTPQRLLGSPFNEQHASFSPDGRFFVYESDESGPRQVYVQPLPPDGSKWQVSTGGLAAMPRWRSDGKEVFYDSGGPRMAVDVAPRPRGRSSAPAPRTSSSGACSHSIRTISMWPGTAVSFWSCYPVRHP